MNVPDHPLFTAYSDAHAAAVEARTKLREALDAWTKYRTEQVCLIGKKVTNGNSTIVVDEVVFIVAHEVKPWRVVGRMIKKNGEVGKGQTSIYCDVMKIID